MDHPGPILTLSGGIDIHGKLLFPDSNTYKIEVRTPLIAVQGELEMISSSKAVDGTPLVKFLMTGDADQTYTPVGENALACGGGGTCNAGKKAVVVAGGKMNSTFVRSMMRKSCCFKRGSSLKYVT